MVRHRIALGARSGLPLVVFLAASVAVAAPPLYRITEVPVAGGMPVAEAINDQGVIVGTLHGDKARAYRWRDGRSVEFAPLDDPHREQYAVSVDERGAMSYWVQWPGNGLPGKFLRTEVWAQGATPAKKLRGVFSYFGNTAGDLVVDRRAVGRTTRARFRCTNRPGTGSLAARCRLRVQQVPLSAPVDRRVETSRRSGSPGTRRRPRRSHPRHPARARAPCRSEPARSPR